MRTFAENFIFPWLAWVKLEKFAIVNLPGDCKTYGKLASAPRAKAQCGHKIMRKAA
jgi:hypothetical protein